MLSRPRVDCHLVGSFDVSQVLELIHVARFTHRVNRSWGDREEERPFGCANPSLRTARFQRISKWRCRSSRPLLGNTGGIVAWPVKPLCFSLDRAQVWILNGRKRTRMNSLLPGRSPSRFRVGSRHYSWIREKYPFNFVKKGIQQVNKLMYLYQS